MKLRPETAEIIGQLRAFESAFREIEKLYAALPKPRPDLDSYDSKDARELRKHFYDLEESLLEFIQKKTRYKKIVYSVSLYGGPRSRGSARVREIIANMYKLESVARKVKPNTVTLFRPWPWWDIREKSAKKPAKKTPKKKTKKAPPARRH